MRTSLVYLHFGAGLIKDMGWAFEQIEARFARDISILTRATRVAQCISIAQVIKPRFSMGRVSCLKFFVTSQAS